jgi:hypothetical protein
MERPGKRTSGYLEVEIGVLSSKDAVKDGKPYWTIILCLDRMVQAYYIEQRWGNLKSQPKNGVRRENCLSSEGQGEDGGKMKQQMEYKLSTHPTVNLRDFTFEFMKISIKRKNFKFDLKISPTY